jgi:sulfoxide reductase heme-binding subunit YedZ
MGGKNWQRLHRLIYVAGAAACIHYWWLVKAGVRTPWKDTAVLVLLLLARVLYAVWRRIRKRAVPPLQQPV